eukprot:TRINITY_DN5408_c0_g2_i1.p1 TRINITY_DN5408_c0_g2~~TRINITY_DN5408_c0_g2_i1.p1  ORF type:complete len:627 (+),score=97.83 TRINITY_DN5408_c0_g2_i1:181-2061(+)
MKGVVFNLLFVFAVLVVVSEGLIESYPKTEYSKGAKVTLYANKLTSSDYFVPYGYYDFPFCRNEPLVKQKENIGQKMSGDDITESPYAINALEDVECAVLNSYVPNCDYYSQDQLQRFVDLINKQYKVLWFLDNLPGGERRSFIGPNGEMQEMYYLGYDLGSANRDPEFPDVISINNHASITVVYNKKEDSDDVYIVGVVIEPKSVQYNFEMWNKTRLNNCVWDVFNAQPVNPIEGGTTILWTYSVKWEENQNIQWSQRWDKYIGNADSQIHWFSFVNGLVILGFLTVVVVFIFVRKIRADFTMDGEIEEVGWKLIYGDVFRPPKWPNLFSAFVGAGIHILVTSTIILILSVFGFINPSNRGSILTTSLSSFVLLSAFAGYFSERTLKIVHGSRWKRVAFFTILAFSGTSFVIYFIVNMALHARNSSAALSAGTFTWVFVVWFFVPLILVFVGVIIAIKKYEYTPPARVNQIPRQIPEQRWYVSQWIVIPIGGILPFAIVFIEFFFIENYWWRGAIDSMAFDIVTLLMMIIVCIEVSVILCYFQLCSEDYHWWWRSFLVTGSSGVYMFLYSILFFVSKTEASGVSVVVYFGYMLITSWGFFLVTGTIGFLASFSFINRLMTRIPID